MFLKHTRTNEAKFHQERIYNLLLNLNLNDRENIKKEKHEGNERNHTSNPFDGEPPFLQGKQ